MNNFDKIIKNKLEGLHPVPSDDAWSKFAQKKSQVLHTETAETKTTDTHNRFDTFLQHSLANISPAYNPEHWNLLYERLQIIQTRQNTIIVSKALEVLAIFLIVLTSYQVNIFDFDRHLDTNIITEQTAIPSAQNVSKSKDKLRRLPESTKQTSSKPEVQKRNSTINLLPSNFKSDIKNEAVKLPVNTVDTLNKNTQIVALLDLQSNEALETFVPNISENAFAINNSKVSFDNEKVLQVGEAISNIDEINTIAAQDFDFGESPIISKNKGYLLSSKLEQIIALSDVVEKMESKNLSLVEQLPNILPEVYSEIALSFPEINLIKKDKKKSTISAFTSTDINLINTPFDKLYSKAAYSKEAMSNSFGVLLGKEKNNFGIESGLIYSNRTYQPQSITDIYGQSQEYYFEKTFNKISYDIVSVPLNVKYKFINNKKWSAYVVSNLALNLVVNAQYNINKEIKSGNIAARYNPESSRLSEKGFISGILNNDQEIENSLASNALKDNYFVSMGIGFGISKYLTKRISLFMQPMYNRHMFSNDIGIGPNKDKIHSASLMIGATCDFN